MNRYPLWKNLMILAVILVAALYALPNLFGQDPSIEVTPLSKTAEITDGSVTQVEAALRQHDLAIKRIDREPDRLRIRFNDGETQLKAMDLLPETMGGEYAFALNLVADVPEWLMAIGGDPMSLGLDLRGGIHVLIDVDMDTALKNTLTDTRSDLQRALREEKIFGQLRLEETGVRALFRTEEERDRAERIFEDNLRDFEVDTFETDQEYGVL
ncbi:MAG: protein translocase subunit SecD, partial [Sedimenticolaceae bacterium]|nr:protein translocase subunit SecD [Sedimenticolaceae bacterium]